MQFSTNNNKKFKIEVVPKKINIHELASTELVFQYESELYLLPKNNNHIVLSIHKLWTATVIQVLVMGKKAYIKPNDFCEQ